MPKKLSYSAPYPPSWQNRFLQAVDRLPFPNIVIFLGLFIGIAFLQHLIPWLEGLLPRGQVEWRQFYFLMPALVTPFFFGNVLTYSEKALTKFRLALNVSTEEYAQLSYRFLNLPAATGWIITLGVALGIALIYRTPFFQASYPSYLLTGFSGFLIFFTSSVSLSIVFSFLVFVGRQALFVGQLYAQVRKINLFNLGPLYALSSLTSRVGTLFIIVGTVSFLSNSLLAEGNPQNAVNVFFGVINLGLALALFILPLLGIHQRLVSKKEELLSETGERVRAAFARMNKEQASGKLKEIGNTRQLIDAVIREREYIQGVPTWPWNAATLRTFITALLVPLTVWSVQQLLLRIAVK